MRRARTSTIFAFVCVASVTMPACEPVSEVAVVAEVDDRHRDERARDALADRDEHVELARLRAVGDLVREASRSSVVLPIAETTATTRCPPPWRATQRRATRFSFSVSPTEVPPNFITTSPASGRVL